MHFSKAAVFFLLVLSTVFAAPMKCGENEEFRECGTACEANCADGLVMFCTRQCIVNVCQCKPGFFRNKDKKCIPKSKC